VFGEKTPALGAVIENGLMRWLGLSEQRFWFAKWSLCRG
jgi:hypothetical protein